MVRSLTVEGSPTAGGLAGYLRKGTTTTATNPTPPSRSEPARGVSAVSRGPTAPSTTAKIAPRASPNTISPIAPPISWVPRAKRSS